MTAQVETTERMRVCVADDHAIVREGLRHVIETQPDMVVVAEAADGSSTLEAARAHKPDVIVLDLSMPGGGGLAAVAPLKQLEPAPRIVVLTVHEERAYVRQLLAAGVEAYVVKRSASAELIHAIRRARVGATYVDSTLASTLLARDSSTKSPGGAELTDRETEVVKLIARGFGNTEIALRLGISVKTVETHRARIMDKMGFRSRADMVRYALSAGLLSKDDDV